MVLLAVTRPGIKGGVVRGSHAFAADAAVVVTAAVALAVPWLVNNPDFATGRGRLWAIAHDLSQKNVWFGRGSTSWFREFSAGSFGRAAAYSSHNQWVEVTLFLGLVGVVLFAVIIYSLMASKENRFLVASVLVAMFALGVTERPIALALVDLMSWSLFALFMVAGSDQFFVFAISQGALEQGNRRNRT